MVCEWRSFADRFFILRRTTRFRLTELLLSFQHREDTSIEKSGFSGGSGRVNCFCWTRTLGHWKYYINREADCFQSVFAIKFIKYHPHPKFNTKYKYSLPRLIDISPKLHKWQNLKNIILSPISRTRKLAAYGTPGSAGSPTPSTSQWNYQPHYLCSIAYSSTSSHPKPTYHSTPADPKRRAKSHKASRVAKKRRTSSDRAFGGTFLEVVCTGKRRPRRNEFWGRCWRELVPSAQSWY